MRENRKYHLLEPYVPPGMPIGTLLSSWIFCMAASTCWCMLFIVRYLDYRGQLFEYRNGRRVLLENAKMPNFEYLTVNLFEVFGIVLLFCALVVVYHYYYHYQGSRMMYLMRRLPNKWEVHIRCFALPIAAGVITIVYMLVLRMLFYAVYVLCTPSQCLIL